MKMYTTFDKIAFLAVEIFQIKIFLKFKIALKIKNLFKVNLKI
jgi:hypothetical protein